MQVTDIAGKGVPGFQDGPAGHYSRVEFDYPYGVATDGLGNAYVADTRNNRIRKVAADGSVTTLAGNGFVPADGGFGGFANGTGGPDGGAEFSSPAGVAVDGSGNVYVADYYNNRIRKVDPEGNVTTLAGTGAPGQVDSAIPLAATFNSPTGVAVDSSGNVYVADELNNAIRMISTSAGVTTLAGKGNFGFADGTGGPSGTAEFSFPSGVAVDGSGNVFVADSANNRIRKITPGTVIQVTTVAGDGFGGFEDGSGTGGPDGGGTAWFSNPTGLALDGSGNLFVADQVNCQIREILAASGQVITLAGNGAGFYDGTGGVSGTSAFFYPSGVALDVSGNILVADAINNAIRRVAPDGNVITLAGNEYSGFVDGVGDPPGDAEFYYPNSVAVDAAGNLYISDESNNRIRKVATDGSVTTLAGNGAYGFADGTGGPDGGAEFEDPTGIVVDGSGNVFVSDAYNNRIRKIAFGTGEVTTVAGNGLPSSDGGTGWYSEGDGGALSADFGEPAGLALDGAGNLYVADYSDYRIRKITPEGAVITLAGNGNPGSTAPDGGFVPPFADGSGGANGTAEFYLPAGVAVDGVGNVYVADQGNNRIRMIALDGGVTTLAGNGNFGLVDGSGGPHGTAEFDAPTGVAVDGSGNVYVADFYSSAIRSVAPNGTVTTLAGNGFGGFANGTGGFDGGAELFYPSGVALDGQGHIFVADTGNNCIREILP